MNKYSSKVSKNSSCFQAATSLERTFFKNKMASRDFEKEFDPTQWSSRIKDSKELLASHLEFGNTGKLIKFKINLD